MDSPKNRRSRAGVTKMPITLLITALQSADATFPPAAVVRMMHMLMVVGRQVSISSPSRIDLGNKLGRNAPNPFVSGRPTRKGQATMVLKLCSKVLLPVGEKYYSPKNRRSRAGVTKMPITLLITALQSADATFPPAAVVRMMHMLMVVGRQVSISSPSRIDLGNKLGRNAPNPFVSGRPTRKGQATNIIN